MKNIFVLLFALFTFSLYGQGLNSGLISFKTKVSLYTAIPNPTILLDGKSIPSLSSVTELSYGTHKITISSPDIKTFTVSFDVTETSSNEFIFTHPSSPIIKIDSRIDSRIEQDSIFDMEQLTVDVAKFGGSCTGPAEEVDDEDIPLVFAEEMPKFMGNDGQTEFSRWCQQNLIYPPIALDNGVQGSVTVSFVVERNGDITNIKLMRGVDRELDKAALEIVKKSPKKWTPAKNNGRPVRLMIQMPIVFKLN